MSEEIGLPAHIIGNHSPPSSSHDESMAGLHQEQARLQHANGNQVNEAETTNEYKKAIDTLEDLVAQLRTANQNLVLATVKAQTMQEEAEAANRRQNEFLAMLAHELRNPLAPIGNAAALLERITNAHPLLPKVHGVINRQVEHMARLLNDLLDASRINSGKITLQKQPVFFTEIIERAVESSQPFFEQRKQQLKIDLQVDTILINVDPDRLVQVFSNLLINASKFTHDQGLITLVAEKQADHIVMTVKDNGMGIALSIQPYIFDLFMQGPRSLARTEGGLGIGLTVARRLVEMHDGTISVASDGPGQGSAFKVSLPVHVLQQTHTAAVAAAAPKTTVAGHSRILLIEDNVDTNETLKMLLELEGHAVTSVFDGRAGLTLAKANAYEVIICDIGLPGIDGFEIIKQLRQQTGPVTPFVVALSGYGQLEDRNRALQLGFDQYLVKPIKDDFLLRVVASRVPALPNAAHRVRIE